MAEEDLKRAILEKIRREKGEILAQARQEEAKILAEAEREASSFKESCLAELKKRCSLEKTKELGQVKLERERQLLEAKEKKIYKVLSVVRERLEKIHQDKEGYKPIFRVLLAEALENFGKGVKLQMTVSPSDRELALESIKELKLDGRLETEGSIDGGVILSDLEKTLIALNTFSSRLAKLMPELRQEVSKILFGVS